MLGGTEISVFGLRLRRRKGRRTMVSDTPSIGQRRAGAGSPPVSRLSSWRGASPTAAWSNIVRYRMSHYVIEHEDVLHSLWTDSSDHINSVFDPATDAPYAVQGIGMAYREPSGNSSNTAETHTVYSHEVQLVDRLIVKAMLPGVDTMPVRYFHELYRTENGERSAVQEIMPLDLQASVAAAVRRYKPATCPKARAGGSAFRAIGRVGNDPVASPAERLDR